MSLHDQFNQTILLYFAYGVSLNILLAGMNIQGQYPGYF